MPFRFFGGGVLGPHDQWVSWIHIDDEVDLILCALDSDLMSGPVNATSPNPVTMADFSKGIGHALKRPVWVPVVPTFLRLVMGERAEPLFASQRVFPDRALGLGFQFKYVNANQALDSLLADDS
jgi:NAD dependent epimerase/dehydratase family enzyme